MYELFLTLPAQLPEAQVKAKTKEIEEKIKAIGGKLKESFDLGRRALAYPIIRQGTRYNEGYYLDLYFETDRPDKINQLENELRLEAEILRFLIINQQNLPQKHPLQAKMSQERRPGQKQAKTSAALSKKLAPSQAKKYPSPKPEKPRPSEKKKVELEKFDEKLEEILEG